MLIQTQYTHNMHTNKLSSDWHVHELTILTHKHIGQKKWLFPNSNEVKWRFWEEKILMSHTVLRITNTQKSGIKNQVPQYEIKHFLSNISSKTKWFELCYPYSFYISILSHYVTNCLILCILDQSYLNEILKRIFWAICFPSNDSELQKRLQEEDKVWVPQLLLLCIVVVLFYTYAQKHHY